jgi:hypothetical protein
MTHFAILLPLSTARPQQEVEERVTGWTKEEQKRVRWWQERKR